MSPMKIDVVGSKWTATWPDFAGLVKSIDGRKGLVVVERATGVLQTINVGQGDVLEKLEPPALTDPDSEALRRRPDQESR
jgi:hypothetical protein